MKRDEAKARLMEYGLTEAEAEELITKAEQDNCEPTSRLRPDWDTTIEFKGQSTNGYNGVEVYYYPEENEIERAGDDLSNVDWTIAKYEVW